MERSDAPLVLYDGSCGICSAAVQFVLRRDGRARFRFAALQSAAGRQALLAAGWNGPPPESLVLVADGRVRMRTDAALAIAARLRWPWPLCAVFRIVPGRLRDVLYDAFARRRHRWSGRAEGCPVLPPEQRARFLDADEGRSSD